MDYIVSNSVPLILLGGGVVAYAVLGTDACKKKKVTNNSTSEATYKELIESKSKPKKAKDTSKKVVDKSLYKSIDVASSDEEVKPSAKSSKKVAAAAAKVTAPVKAVEEPKAKKAEPEVERVESEVKKTEEPKDPRIAEQEAEIARLRALVDNMKKTKPAEDVYNPTPMMTKEDLEAQRREEARLTEQYQSEWHEVPTRRVKEKKPAASTEEKEEVKITENKILGDVQVPVDKRSLIIGKNAETIKKISELTGAKIDIPKGDSKNTKVVLEGTREAVDHAKKIITEIVQKTYSSELNPELTEARVSVDVDKRAAVLGPKGSNIQKIIDVTGVRINFPDRDSSSTSVQIIGDEHGVSVAKGALRQLVKDGFSTITHEGWAKMSVRFPFAYRRNLIGPKGQVIKSIQNTTGCKITIPENDDEHVVVVGPSAQVYNAEASIRKIQQRLDTPVVDEVVEGFDEEIVDDEESW